MTKSYKDMHIYGTVVNSSVLDTQIHPIDILFHNGLTYEVLKYVKMLISIAMFQKHPYLGKISIS